MKRKSASPRSASNAALAILFTGAAIVAPAVAQDAGKATPTTGATLQYVGADTRVGIGYDTETKLRGELFHVLRGDDTSATLAEIWASRDAGGAKLSQHWSGNGRSVNKLFAAFDQSPDDMRKATLGGGQEYETWFWNTYLSKGLSGARLSGTAAIANTITQSGTESGRPYVEDVTTTVTTRAYQRPYDWGVGARAGHFYEGALLRVTAGIDYEWGKFSAKLWTGTLTAEKFFAGSPISVALSGEINRRSGDFESKRSDQRGMVMLRYELGAPKTSFRANKVTRSVTSSERVPDPNWKPAVIAAPDAAVNASASAATANAAPAPLEPTTREEKRITRVNSNDAQETYFDLGSTRLKPAAIKELDALMLRIAALQPYVELKVNIVGHTCPTGGDRNNVALSTQRADAVKLYLVSRGLPTELVTTSGQAGRSPKYPEVKGQSFRNRRADTDVVVVKEKTEVVRVVVPGSTAAMPAPPLPPSPSGSAVATTPTSTTAPMIDREVTRELVDDVPNNWIARALHNTSQHKATVDGYRWLEASTQQAIGTRRYINRGPSAVNDAYTVDCAAPITFNVLGNDTDPDGDALTITSVSMAGKGTVAISGGKIVYTPSAARCGGATDSFTYSISDGKGGVSTATVSVTINNTLPPPPPPPPPPPINNAPLAVNDAYTIDCAAASTFSVLVNDSDKDGDALGITSVSTPGKGTAMISSGKVVYTPNASTCGGATDSFTYSISDGKGGVATASVSVTINNTAPPPPPPPPPVNNAPLAVNDAYTVDCAAASTFNVLVNDSDKDGDALSITSVSTPGKGTAMISSGKVVYTPNASTCGGATDSFTYSISDGKGGTATASVAVTINNTAPPPPPVNNAPVAVNDRFVVPCAVGMDLNVLVNDSDSDGDALTIISTTQPTKSSISIVSNGKSLRYTPGPACFIDDTFTYTISDGKGGTATATVTLIDP